VVLKEKKKMSNSSEDTRQASASRVGHVRHYEINPPCSVITQVNADWEEAFEKHFEPSNFSTPVLKAAMAEVFRAGWDAGWDAARKVD
jgi:hypothetical protein